MSHKWWKSMAVWGSLVDKVFLSIYMSKCMEHGKLNHLLFHDIRYKWKINIYSIPRSSFSKRLIIQTQLELPLHNKNTLLVNLHPFIYKLGVETKNDDLLRYFHRKSNRWDAVTNLLLAEKRLNEPRGQEWVKRGYEKKRDEARQVRRIWTAPPVQVNTESLPFDDSVFWEKKWSFQNFLLSKLQRREGYLTQIKKASVNRHIYS